MLNFITFVKIWDSAHNTKLGLFIRFGDGELGVGEGGAACY
jgi:hypothetical protein